MSLISRIASGELLRELSGVSGSGRTSGNSNINGQGVSASFGGSDATQLAPGLRSGASALSNSYIRLSDSLSKFRTTEAALQDLLTITEELIDVADRAANQSSSSRSRAYLQGRFETLITDFKDVLANADKNGVDLLKKDDLEEALSASGIDTDMATTLSEGFKRIAGSDGELGFGTEQEPYGSATTTDQSFAGDETFQPAASFTVGTDPRGVATGDFDRDGELDMVVTDADNATVSVLLGNGDGTFDPRVTYTVGTQVRSVAVGDFDGDNKLDIVTTDRSDDTVSVLTGNGDGTFDPRATFSVGDQPEGIAIGYFDADENLDIVTANNGTDNISILLGNGDGTFDPDVTYDAGNQARGVAVGDFDGDTFLDIVTANNADDNVSVLLGNGDGTFDPQTTFDAGDQARAVTIGDFDGDTFLDIVTADNADATVSVLLGNGDGTFDPRTTYDVGANSRAVSVGDLNKDGVLDIAAVDQGPNTVSILLGTGTGTFDPRTTVSTGANPSSVALGDFNGDGVLDIVAGASGANEADVFIQDSSTVTTSTLEIATAFSDVLKQDLSTRAGASLAVTNLEELRDEIEHDLNAVSSVINELEGSLKFALEAAFAFDEAAQSSSIFKGVVELSQEIASKIKTRTADTSLAEHSELDRALVNELLGS